MDAFSGGRHRGVHRHGAQRREEADGPDGDGLPWVELPDPLWTVDARYDILSGGTRAGGPLSLLWEKIQAEVEASNENAVKEGLHLIQLPASPDGDLSCTRCGQRKPWKFFHSFSRRRCRGAAKEVDEQGQLVRPWTDAGTGWARSRQKKLLARRRAKLQEERRT